jgi:hypothetical protein
MKVTRIVERELPDGDTAQLIEYDDGSKAYCYFSGGPAVFIEPDGTRREEQFDCEYESIYFDALQEKYAELMDDYAEGGMTDKEFEDWDQNRWTRPRCPKCDSINIRLTEDQMKYACNACGTEFKG